MVPNLEAKNLKIFQKYPQFTHHKNTKLHIYFPWVTHTSASDKMFLTSSISTCWMWLGSHRYLSNKKWNLKYWYCKMQNPPILPRPRLSMRQEKCNNIANKFYFKEIPDKYMEISLTIFTQVLIVGMARCNSVRLLPAVYLAKWRLVMVSKWTCINIFDYNAFKIVFSNVETNRIIFHHFKR